MGRALRIEPMSEAGELSPTYLACPKTPASSRLKVDALATLLRQLSNRPQSTVFGQNDESFQMSAGVCVRQKPYSRGLP
jgi:hypothetical protein